MIHLGQDENDCFSAWVTSKEAGLVPNEEQKVNYGNMLLQALLEHWWKSLSDDGDCHGDQPGAHHDNEYFPLPGHTPVILRYRNLSLSRFFFK